MRVFQLIRALTLTIFLAACGDSGPGEAQQAVQATPAGAPQAMPCEIVMGWDPWEPYQYEITGGHVFGLDVDLLTAVVSNAGCEIRFQKGPWRELLQQLNEGEIDVLAGATSTSERDEFAYFTEPYRDEQFYLYVAANRLPEVADKNFAELMADGFLVGVVDDYLYGAPISSYQDDPVYNDQFKYSSMAEINVSRLLDGQVDGIIEDKFVGASIIRHKNLSASIKPHPLHFDSSPVSIMVSRASVDPELFERINQSVRDLKANGGIDKVLAQYRNP